MKKRTLLPVFIIMIVILLSGRSSPVYACELVWDPHPDVRITFPAGSEIESVTAVELTGCPQFPRQFKSLFLITMVGDYDPSDGDIRVCIRYDPTIVRNPEKLILVRFDGELLGDLNCDGLVNGRDISIIARALNTQPNDPKWNPICDLNGDNVIDLLDKSIAQANMGETAWTVIPSTVDGNWVCGDTTVLSIWGIR